METLQFKTNIKCSGCIEKVTPELNDAVGQANWTVDVQNPDKILTVTADGITSKDIVQAVEKAGFKAAVRS